MSANTFAALMSDLLQELKMPRPGGLHQQVCTLHFNDKPSMHFINHVPQYVDVMSEGGVLANPHSPSVLQELLALNSIDGREWPVSVTLHRPTGMLVAWTRHSLATVEVSALLQTMCCINAKLASIRQLVAKPTSRTETQSATTLLRMAHFNRNNNR